MLEKPKPYDMLTDFVTGKEVPNIGAEENRQQVEHFLLETKGYSKENITLPSNLALDKLTLPWTLIRSNLMCLDG